LRLVVLKSATKPFSFSTRFYSAALWKESINHWRNMEQEPDEIAEDGGGGDTDQDNLNAHGEPTTGLKLAHVMNSTLDLRQLKNLA
jgi:hypothetical protein